MKPKTRLTRLLNQVKRKYKITNKFKIRVSTRDPKKRKDPFMEISFGKIPTIIVYVNKFHTRFEKIPDYHLRRFLVHELIHYVVHECVNDKNPKQIRGALILIDRMIDY